VSDWSIRFEPAGPAFVIICAAIAAGFVASWAYRRVAPEAGRARARALLGLRLSALALVAAILLGPTLRTYVWAGSRGVVAILVDDSESMTIPDSAGPRGKRPRGEAAGELLSGRRGLVAALSRSADVRVFGFGRSLRELDAEPLRAGPTERGGLSFRDGATDIAGALDSLQGLLGGPGGAVAAVLLSDGADTEGGDTERALSRLAASGLPVSTVAFGGSEFVDLELAELRATRTVRKDTLVTVTALVRARGVERSKVAVRLLELPREEGGSPRLIAEHQLDTKGGSAEVTFEFLPAESGFREYAVELPVLEGEPVVQNNRREFALTVERRKIRVLYMEGSEYRRPERKLWEFQYLEEALKEDGDIEVTSLLRKDIPRAREAGIYTVQDPERGFPRTKKGLFEYDVIISSDIDIDFFSREQLENTVEFVAKRGGGFAMVGGWTAFGPGGYDESVIDKLLPVDMTGRFDGYVENEEFRPVVTEEGLRHPVMRLDPDPERNRAIWERVPYFYGHNKVQRAKPGATVLAYHPDDRNLYGQNVILAVQQYGRGRALAMTTDTTAGWGTSFEEEFGEDGDNRWYRRFWQNAVRWLAEYRLGAPSRLVQLEPGRTLLARGETQRVRVTVLDEHYEPAGDAEVTLTVTGPDGRRESFVLPADASRRGEYSDEVRFPELGRYTLKAEAQLRGERLGEDAVSVSVRPGTKEFERPEARHGLLRRIALATGGRFYTEKEAPRLSEDIGDALRSVRRHEDRPLWDSPFVWASLMVLLSAEWFVRKRAGMP